MLWVCLGGAVGSGARYAIALAFASHKASLALPFFTLIANVVGCALIGVLMHSDVSGQWTDELRLGLTTGVLGGFTTFSTFSFESLALARDGRYGLAALYAGGTLLCCLAAVTVGYALTSRLAGS